MRVISTIGIVSLLALTACNQRQANPAGRSIPEPESETGRSTIWDLFDGYNRDTSVQINVSKYLWNASLDVLKFLPIAQADPFSGLIITGYGRAAGASESYRVAVRIAGPELDATNLSVAVQRANGSPASAETVRLVEDAILTRARQLKIADQR